MRRDYELPIAVLPRGAPSPAPVLVDAQGRPITPGGAACPTCGAKADRRVQTSGFGRVRPVICSACGNEDFPAEQA